jgi:hypothetical protein
MERDWDLIREILIRLEEKSDVKGGLQLKDWPEGIRPKVSYHVELMIDGGLVEGFVSKTLDLGPDDFAIFRLTWNGHDFLNSIKNNTVWEKVKKVLVSKGISATIEIAKAIASKIILNEFQL